ncbi:hypothetical protein [Novosphingobium sp. M1R2S20]|uniref:YvrJ-like protein n=1 Tax=Novosphingobium rhizovicinum TaxID=3228928 RepID=A0ABV3RCW7_9SPHN
MDLSGLGPWLGENGPLVGIIGLQWAVIWRLLNRFFAQQDLVMKAMHVAERSAEVVERAVKEK